MNAQKRGDYQAQFEREVGRRIAVWRTKRRMSRCELALRIGVHSHTVDRWEERGGVGLWHLLRICGELETPYATMIPGHALELTAIHREARFERDPFIGLGIPERDPLALRGKLIRSERDPGLARKRRIVAQGDRISALRSGRG